METELAERENRFKAYFDFAPISMAIVDMDERLLQVNNSLCQMLGYSRDQLLSMDVKDITHPDDIEREKKEKRRQGKLAGGHFKMEKRYLHADGRVIWGQLTVSLMKDSDDSPLYYLVLIEDITLRKNVGNERAVNEKRLIQALEETKNERAMADAILAAIGDPLTIQDSNYKIIYQNEANRKTMGDHLGEYCFQAYENNTQVCDGCGLAKSFADSKVHRIERSVTVNNEIKHFEITTSPLMDKSGHAIAGIEIARDVTDRKKTEERLNEQLRLLSLSSDIGSALTTGKTLRHMLGVCCELLVEHLDAAFARIWTANKTEDVLELQASAGMYTHINGPHGRILIDDQSKIGSIANRRTSVFTNSVIGDSQITNQVWAEKEGMIAFAGHPLLVGNMLIGVIGLFFRKHISEDTSRAITAIADEVALGIERLSSEEKLLRSNRALRVLSKCNEILVYTTSESELLEKICAILVEPDGYRMAWIGYADNATKRVLPVTQAGFDQGYLASVDVKWDDSKKGKGPVGEAIRTGKVSVMRNIQVNPNFVIWREKAVKRGYLSIIALPLVDSSLKNFGAIAIYSTDIDAFDDDEIKLLTELSEDLSFGIRSCRLREEHKRGQEEKQQLESRIRQAQKLEAIGTLAGGIAHDFNNILSAILGYAELLKLQIGAKSQAGDDLQQIIQAGIRATDLVRQILTFSRQGAQNRQHVRVQNIIKEALKLLRPSLSVSIEIKSCIDQECDEVFADPTEIHQVIMNLCTNAYHALLGSDNRCKIIEIGLNMKELDNRLVSELALNLVPGRYVRLSVSDSGCGMNVETMEKIFDPYFTTKSEGKGTGLGLATVYGIVVNSAGDISVESEPGFGSVFTVYLPVAEGAVKAKDQLEDRQPSIGGTERILVIDDEEPITKLLNRALGDLGYQVTAFNDAEKAIRHFQKQPEIFDLVITDMNMPKVQGTELARVFLAVRGDIPIILCTGYTEEIDPETANIIGIREVLLKPLAKDVLSRKIRMILDSPTIVPDQNN
ncbi:MAG: PAS domain S-box protein [Proteobacteria bacterium]|nr:PAS domain S-box protein [Pseudomonadota bacterium]